MTAFIAFEAPARQRRAVRTVDVAGVAWPAYKLHALLVGIVVAMAIFALTASGQLTMWVTAGAVLVVWWGGRYRPGNAAVAPASNPPGIS
ncbi:hypothetical protein QSJ18_11795 [Gordonia sp. ABSL1-1]|uniref:hypothetical protein n=1 Tax=Gordonia sp. ABSL1-1 TaxID=3053923 RepID=UPI00257409D1|nr:hypothetical protein [Gordonia sp. ABSL1-1]MDL9937429.1 hypothetical protein [Gordonia sp. ABSL1-1]